MSPFILFLTILHFCACFGSAQACAAGFYLCSPVGASTRDVPEIGPGLARLYLSLVATIDAQAPPSASTNDTAPVEVRMLARQSPGELCCAATSQCLLVQSYLVPACWDRFTTNYYLPDGSYGSITSGDYTTPQSDHANLVSGDYRLANGQEGNVYQGGIQGINTTMLPLPTPWTSKGIGSAIPPSELGTQLLTATAASGNTSHAIAIPGPGYAPTSTNMNTAATVDASRTLMSTSEGTSTPASISSSETSQATSTETAQSGAFKQTGLGVVFMIMLSVMGVALAA